MALFKITKWVLLAVAIFLWVTIFGPYCMNANSDLMVIGWPTVTLIFTIYGGVLAFRKFYPIIRTIINKEFNS